MKYTSNIYVVLFFCFCTQLTYGQDQSINISVASPKVKATDNKENLRSIIKSEIEKSIVGISDYVTLVERDYLEQINYRRAELKRDDNPNIASGAMTGANYLLESKVSLVKFDEGQKVVEKAIKSRRENRYVYWNKVNYTIDFELINVETGEIASQYRMKSDGMGYEMLERKSPNRTKLINKALLESRSCMRNVIEYMVLSTLIVKSRIIDINEIKKDKAKNILIEGGRKSPFRGGLKFDILKVYNQDIGGETIQRQEKIGEAKYKDKFDRVSQCSVSKGDKEVLKAFNEGAQLYCVPRDLKYLETCGQFLFIPSKKSNAASLDQALKPSPKPSTNKESKSSSTTKKKNTKKVKRKSGK
ncbi:MAG: hypothetical protein ACI86M_001513 [Saprospiraceae bacterium]|jgi:hypothetical protein